LEEVAYFDISTVCNGFEGFYIFKPTLWARVLCCSALCIDMMLYSSKLNGL
jgi:hypothetical protein